jgi:hypothetical protein
LARTEKRSQEVKPKEPLNGLVIYPDDVKEQLIPNELSVWQGFVEGWVESHGLQFPGKAWPFTIGARMLMNEEGGLITLPVNPLASRIFGAYSGKEEVPIHGTVLIFGMENDKMEYTNVNPEIVERVMQFHEEMR